MALTGGSSLRIEAAVELLEQGLAQRLLISGVNPDATREQVRAATSTAGRAFDCCVDLGFQAENTVGNAIETADWVRYHHFRTLIVVTADYHMPRALLELHAAMPDVKLHAYPVVTPVLDVRRWWASPEAARRMVVGVLQVPGGLRPQQRRAPPSGRTPVPAGSLQRGDRRVTAMSQPTSGASAQLRSVLFAAWMFASAIVIGVGCLPLMLASPRAAMLPIRLWASGQFWALKVLVGARVEVRGRERLPTGGYLLASKHQGMLDTLVAMTLTPWPCIVLKRELAWIPIFGWYARKARMIVIDRKGGVGRRAPDGDGGARGAGAGPPGADLSGGHAPGAGRAGRL